MIMDVKGNYDKEKILKRYDNISKLIRKGDISDDLGYALEAEILKLKSIFKTVSTQPASIEVTEPLVIKKEDSQDVYNYLINKLKES